MNGFDEDMPNLDSNGGRGSDSVQVPVGPVTSARAKRFKEGLLAFIQAWDEKGTGSGAMEVESTFVSMIGVMDQGNELNASHIASQENQEIKIRRFGSSVNSPRRI